MQKFVILAFLKFKQKVRAQKKHVQEIALDGLSVYHKPMQTGQ